MLSLLVPTARAPSVRTGHHRTPTSQLADHAFQDTLAREVPARGVTPAVGRQQTALCVRRAPLVLPVRAGSVMCVLRAPSRTVPAVLATHVVLALPAPVALVLFALMDLSPTRCLLRARCALRARPERLASALHVRRARSRWLIERPANLARRCPTARICSARTARHALRAGRGTRWTRDTRAAQSVPTVCTARTVRRACLAVLASSRTTQRAA